MGAYHGNKDSATPPATGWRIPFDGPVDDGFTVTMNTVPLSKEEQRKQQAVENSRKINKELEKNREALNKARKEDEDKREKKKSGADSSVSNPKGGNKITPCYT